MSILNKEFYIDQVVDSYNFSQSFLKSPEGYYLRLFLNEDVSTKNTFPYQLIAYDKYEDNNYFLKTVRFNDLFTFDNNWFLRLQDIDTMYYIISLNDIKTRGIFDTKPLLSSPSLYTVNSKMISHDDYFLDLRFSSQQVADIGSTYSFGMIQGQPIDDGQYVKFSYNTSDLEANENSYNDQYYDRTDALYTFNVFNSDDSKDIRFPEQAAKITMASEQFLYEASSRTFFKFKGDDYDWTLWSDDFNNFRNYGYDWNRWLSYGYNKFIISPTTDLIDMLAWQGTHD
jgi:hypothetical protein